MKLLDLIWISIALIILGALIRGAIKTAKQATIHQTQKLEECKTKTTDVEWCYKSIYNIK